MVPSSCNTCYFSHSISKSFSFPKPPPRLSQLQASFRDLELEIMEGPELVIFTTLSQINDILTKSPQDVSNRNCDCNETSPTTCLDSAMALFQDGSDHLEADPQINAPSYSDTPNLGDVGFHPPNTRSGIVNRSTFKQEMDKSIVVSYGARSPEKRWVWVSDVTPLSRNLQRVKLSESLSWPILLARVA